MRAGQSVGESARWLGWAAGQGVGGEAEGAADGAGSAVAGGEDVDVGVADHDGFGGGDGDAGEGGGFVDEGAEAVGVGLLGVEAVAAVVLKEEGSEAEGGADVAGWVDGLVGEDGHGERWLGGADGLESFDGPGVDEGEVEFVDAVVVEEEGESFGYKFFVVEIAGGVAEGAADEHGGAVAEVAGDDGWRELGLAEVAEHGVDGVAEIDAGVDEGAVEIEDEEAGRRDGGH